jgi:hypothetical protein
MGKKTARFSPETRIEVCYSKLTPFAGKWGAYHARLREPGFVTIEVRVSKLEDVRQALKQKARSIYPAWVIDRAKIVSKPATWTSIVPSTAAEQYWLKKNQRDEAVTATA